MYLNALTGLNTCTIQGNCQSGHCVRSSDYEGQNPCSEGCYCIESECNGSVGNLCEVGGVKGRCRLLEQYNGQGSFTTCSPCPANCDGNQDNLEANCACLNHDCNGDEENYLDTSTTCTVQ